MRVRAKEKVYVDNVLRQEGEEFEYNGSPNPHLEPLDKPKDEPKHAPKPDDDDDRPGFSKKK